MGLKKWADKIASRGAKEYNRAAEKIDTVKNGITGIAGAATDVVTGATGAVADGAKSAAGKAVDGVAGKAQEHKDANAKKPSTGSGLLDLFVPAVPKTAATKSKAEKAKVKKPKTL